MKSDFPQRDSQGCVSTLVLAIFVSLVLTSFAHAASKPEVSVYPRSESTDNIGLLIPDAADSADPSITIWLEAASEEGLHVFAVHDSEFLAGLEHYAGVILPDALHSRAENKLLDTLEEYVRSGGNLMLVYDAGTLMPDGLRGLRPALSTLAGVDYALEGPPQDGITRRASFWGTASVMDELQIPPGKAMPAAPELTGVKAEPMASLAPGSPLKPAEVSLSAPLPPVYFTLDTYCYGQVAYTSFITQGTYTGERLLESAAGLVAGLQRQGKGSVLFVNLPLGTLALRTDALMMHGFLHYFAQQIGLPYLAAVPDGVGGLVLNWHLCARDAQPALPVLEKLGFFEQGPYSFHFTAGPDRDKIGDGMGMDLPHNPDMRQWIRFLDRHGNAIGNHGGWAHNIFGFGINLNNEAEFRRYLDLNTEAVERAAGHPIREYSSPQGNLPVWVTRWLADHEFVGYYFTGDNGSAPTRPYRNGERPNPALWAFPIASLGNAASLEDMNSSHMPDAEVAAWFRGMSDFVSREGVSRLIYMHPPGARFYPDALRSWLAKTADLRQRGVFRWYTISGLADFLNARQQVHWHVRRSPNGSSDILSATAPQSLVHQTWFLPRESYRRPIVLDGNAIVRQDTQRWVLVAGKGKHLVVSCPHTSPLRLDKREKQRTPLQLAECTTGNRNHTQVAKTGCRD